MGPLWNLANSLKARRESLARLLDDHGVRPTPQRLLIAELMLTQACHLSADQVLERLRESGTRVSKATVYNTLNLFSTHGLLREIAVDPTRLFYDSTTAGHHHLYNEDTGELVDIASGDIEISRLPELPAGADVQSIDVVIRVRNRPA